MPKGVYHRSQWNGATARERFDRSWIPEPNTGCWLWDGKLYDRKGYGRWNAKPFSVITHRAAWELYVGPIPPGMAVCHRCDTPACVNPDHLFLGTLADNNRDMTRKGRLVTPIANELAARTHCKNGHPYTPENTIRAGHYRGRACRICRHEYERAFRARNYVPGAACDKSPTGSHSTAVDGRRRAGLTGTCIHCGKALMRAHLRAPRWRAAESFHLSGGRRRKPTPAASTDTENSNG